MALALSWLSLAVLAVAHWWSVWRDARRAAIVTKPLALAALVALTWALGAADTDTGIRVIVALGLALVGDLFLLGSGPRTFVAGLVAFLLSNVAWLLAFVDLGLSWWPALIAAVFVLLLLRTAGHRIQVGATREGGPWLGGGTTAYMLVAGALVVTAVGTGRPLVGLGAVCFLLSDLVLGLDRFVGSRPRAELVVMLAYHVGQTLMVVGVLS